MRFILRSIILLMLAFSSLSTSAGQNPISWSLNRVFENPVIVGRSYTIIYTFTNQLPFQLKKPIIIEKNGTPSSEFNYTDGCSGLKLQQGQSCTVSVTLAPIVSGTKSLQLVVTGYDNNRVLIPQQVTSTQGTLSNALVSAAVTQGLVSSSTTGQSSNYLFTFTNNSQTTNATNVSVNVTQTSGTPSYTTTCLSSLNSTNTCTVSGSYTPTSSSPSVQGVTASMSYAQGSPASATTATTVSSATGVTGFFVGSDYLPPVMVGGNSNQQTIKVNFINNGPGNANVTASGPGQPISITVNGSDATLSNVANGCLSLTLQPTQACQISATFTANTEVTATPVTVTAQVSYVMQSGGGTQTASLPTSTTVVESLGDTRTLQFVNNCNFTVWFSLNGGAVGAGKCSTDTDCVNNVGVGAACSPITSTCFWKNYAADSSQPFMMNQNDMRTVTIPATSADPNIQWSGNISASTGCDGSSNCVGAPCYNNGGSTACEQGQGFIPPATQAEITFNKFTTDSYDVEVINGFHIPISMTPGPYVTPNNYSCGTAGQSTAGNGFGACDWTTASPPNSTTAGGGYYWVTETNESCNISSPSCSSNLSICGVTSTFNQRCGDFLGYWTADQLCSYPALPSSISSYLSCNTPISSLNTQGVSFPAGAILYDLMGCSVPKNDANVTYNSCYLTYSGVPASGYLPCCGCIDWWNVAGIDANPNTISCTQPGQVSPQTDPVWNSYLQNTVAWLKKACPSAYVYPFDDKSSSFTCTNNLPSNINSVGYTITFCAGNTGLPSGKTEGR